MTAPLNNLPKLDYKEIQDLVIRKNFSNLDAYFQGQNQLLGFEFFELDFTAASTNQAFNHSLGTVPQDVIITKVTGTGTATFNHGNFTTTQFFVTASGPCRVRCFVGTYWNYQTTVNNKATDTASFNAIAAATLQSGIVTLPLTSANLATGNYPGSSANTYYVQSTDKAIFGATASASPIAYLPKASTVPGNIYDFVKIDASNGNSFTVYPAQGSGDTIGGRALSAFNQQYASLRVFSDGTSTWKILSSEFMNLRTVSSTATLNVYDDVIIMSSLGGSYTFTLAKASLCAGKTYYFSKTSSDTNTITIQCAGTDSFGSRTSITLASPGDYATLYSTGSSWLILAKKENTLLSSTGSHTGLASGLSASYVSGSATVTVTPGTWRLWAYYNIQQTAASASDYFDIGPTSGFYAADGANTTGAPSSLSGLAGAGSFAWGVGAQWGGTASYGSNAIVPLGPAQLTVTTNTAVYAVLCLATVGSGVNVYTAIYAERIF